jgi:hypothetical protein
VYTIIKLRENTRKGKVKKMKKMVIIIALMLAVVGANFVDTHYTRENCEVVSYIEDVVVVEDQQGHHWSFKGEGYEVGELVDLKMNTNGTDSYIADDIVEEVEYSK